MGAIFELFGKLMLDKSEFDKNIDEAEEKGEGFGTNFSNVIEKAKKVLVTSGIVVGIGKIGSSFMGAIDKTAAYADAVDKGAQRIGLSYKAYQEWDYALGMSGASIDDLSIGVKNLNSFLNGTATDDVAAVFEKLGINAKDAQGNVRDTADVLNDVIYALASMDQSAERSDLAKTLFGNSSAVLNAFFNSGKEGLQDLVDEANDLGLVMSDDAVKQGAATNDAMDRLQQTLDRLITNVMEPFLPIVSDIADVLTPIVKEASSLLSKILTPLLKLAGYDPDRLEFEERAKEQQKEWEKNAAGGKDLLQSILDIYSGKSSADEVAKIAKERNVSTETAQYWHAKQTLRDYGFDEEAVKRMAQEAYELAYHKTFSTGQQLKYASGDENWFNKIATDYADSISVLEGKGADLSSAFSDTKSAAENAAAAMNSIPNLSGMNSGGDDSEVKAPGFAKGLYDVPYDNFPAILHQGEAVLSASQARRYRDGEGNVNFEALVNAVTSAVRAGMAGAVVRSYLNGKDVTDDVARRMGNTMKSKRYAT